MSGPNQAAIREAIQRAKELASKMTNSGPVKRTASEFDDHASTGTVKVTLAYEKPPDFDRNRDRHRSSSANRDGTNSNNNNNNIDNDNSNISGDRSPNNDYRSRDSAPSFGNSNNVGGRLLDGVANRVDTTSYGGGAGGDRGYPPRDRSRGPGSSSGGGSYGAGPTHYDEKLEIIVPHSVIGLVIGRGGANIKRIQSETGATVRVDPNTVDDNGNKVCTITGTKQAVEEAHKQVASVIENSANSNKRPRTQPPSGRPGQDALSRGPSSSGPHHGQHQHNSHQHHSHHHQTTQQQTSNMLGATSQQQGAMLGQQPEVSATWAAYYAQYSSLMNNTQQPANVAAAAAAAAVAQSQQLPNQPAGIPSMSGQVGPGLGSTPAPAVAQPGGAGQPDYTDQWIEFYLTNGRPDYAEQVIEMKKQYQLQQQASTQPPSSQPSSSATSSSLPPLPPT